MKLNHKTILFAHAWWTMGGAENVLLDWIKACRQIDNLKIIDVVNEGTYDECCFLKDKFEKVVDEQYALDGLSTNPMNKLKFLWNLIKLEKPDIIFIMTNSQIYSLLPFIREILPDTIIVDLLHMEDFCSSGWFGVADEYKNCIDKRIVISDFWKEIHVKKYGEKTDRVFTAYNSVNVSVFDPTKYSRELLRKKCGIDKSKIVVGFVGRFDFQKNPMTFLELADLMSDDNRFIFCIVGGGGNYEKRVLEKIKTQPNVKYFGKTNSPEKIYPIMDVMVFPSVFEGYPLVGMESAAMNVPIIATDVPGFHEQIELGKFGFLYQQDEQKKDAKKIRDILYSNLSNLKNVGNNGRSFAQKYHDSVKQEIIYKSFIKSLFK